MLLVAIATTGIPLGFLIYIRNKGWPFEEYLKTAFEVGVTILVVLIFGMGVVGAVIFFLWLFVGLSSGGAAVLESPGG